MRSAYQPLGAYLARQPGPTCALSFREVEMLLRRPLPPAACTLRAWWSNHHAHSQAYYGWRVAGWRIESVDLERQLVTFRRG